LFVSKPPVADYEDEQRKMGIIIKFRKSNTNMMPPAYEFENVKNYGNLLGEAL
jgi:hypothetical protein